MTEVISFTKVRLPYGWMGNMSAHSVRIDGVLWRTAEHAFQAGRFPLGHKLRKGLQEIKSPMEAKMVVKPFLGEAMIELRSEEDLDLMRRITWCKMRQNDLDEDLIATGGYVIIEDITKRNRGSGPFWGAALIDGEWVGENWLGRIWMEHRAKLRDQSC